MNAEFQSANHPIRHGALISVIAFLLNLAWEYAQCSQFFIHGNVKPTHGAMLLATGGDVGITWGIYSVVALRCRDWFWSLKQWRRSEIILVLALTLVVAAIIEIRALRTGRWSYSPMAPLLPGTLISIIPLAQLFLLVPFSLWIESLVAKRCLRQ